MHLKLLTILAFISLFIFCKSVKPDCSNFRTGIFELTDSLLGKSYMIERGDSVQLETIVETGVRAVFAIEWLSDCSYTLSLLQGEPELTRYYKDKKLIINILETSIDSYKYEIFMEGSSIRLYRTMKKIK